MAQAIARGRRAKPVIDGYDHIEVASIDSFPASDPPGWIEAKAHPCADRDAATAEGMPGRNGQGRKARRHALSMGRATQLELLAPDPIPIAGSRLPADLALPTWNTRLLRGVRYDFGDSRTRQAPEVKLPASAP